MGDRQLESADGVAAPPSRSFFLGCAVWGFDRWVGTLFPAGTPSRDFLTLYSRRLTTVEGNTTFYSQPSPATVQRWRAQVPPEFQFCWKLPRTITHAGLLAPQIPAMQAFVDLMQPLGPNLGPYFAQLPPRYSPSPTAIADLATFLDAWPQDRAQLALEVRHLGWFQPQWAARLQALLGDRGIGRVLLDTRPIYDGDDDPQVQSERRKPQVPLQPMVTASFAIVRYIGHPTLERNVGYLTEWVTWVRATLAAGTRIYFFVHCPEEARSPGLVQYFQEQLEAAQVPVSPLPWLTLPPVLTPTQLSLFG